LTEISWASDYVGLPFKDGGRDRRGSIAGASWLLVYAERLGIRLPDFAEVKAMDGRAVAKAIVSQIDSGQWLPVLPGRRAGI
jgi:probable lipoprotein NlpC